MEARTRVEWNDGPAKAAVKKAAQEALMQAGHDIQAEAQKIVPHQYGTLEDSATTEPVMGMVGVRVSFGGPASAYAAVQHEVQMLHPNGRQWKYLETPMKAKAPLIPRLVELTVKAALKGGG